MKSFFKKGWDTVTRKHCKPLQNKHRDKPTITMCANCDSKICANCWNKKDSGKHTCPKCASIPPKYSIQEEERKVGSPKAKATSAAASDLASDKEKAAS